MLDGIIIAAYLIGVLCLGSSIRSKSRADFLLGKCRMRAGPLALSLFVSWFSLISYTAIPGEVLSNGPLLWCGLAAAPVTLCILCGVVIPRLRTRSNLSGYEILDQFELRWLAAGIFILIRLAWMGMIVHLASTLVLHPLVPAVGPIWWQAILVGVTVAYALSGFRAVVWADVAQAGIMVAGAVWCLAYCRLWWPQTWPETWSTPGMAFDPYARMSVPTAILGALTMGLVVKTGDQMALQRFLAARSTADARRVMLGGFAADCLLTGLLVLVGFSLLGRYGSDLGDRTFLQFLSTAPPGCLGLVVAALLAAGMSSLSSGINAIHLSISEDFRVLLCKAGRVE